VLPADWLLTGVLRLGREVGGRQQETEGGEEEKGRRGRVYKQEETSLCCLSGRRGKMFVV